MHRVSGRELLPGYMEGYLMTMGALSYDIGVDLPRSGVAIQQSSKNATVYSSRNATVHVRVAMVELPLPPQPPSSR